MRRIHWLLLVVVARGRFGGEGPLKPFTDVFRFLLLRFPSTFVGFFAASTYSRDYCVSKPFYRRATIAPFLMDIVLLFTSHTSGTIFGFVLYFTIFRYQKKKKKKEFKLLKFLLQGYDGASCSVF